MAAETYILFSVAATTYALRSHDVAHVEMIEQVTRVPNAAAFVDGVVFSRGVVVPALNLRARFGFERAPHGVSSRLIVVRHSGRTVGLVVDAAREFASIDAASIHPPAAALTGLSGRYLEGVANLGDRLVLVLNLEAILEFSDPVLEQHA